jgi:hypothetical protein
MRKYCILLHDTQDLNALFCITLCQVMLRHHCGRHPHHWPKQIGSVRPGSAAYSIGGRLWSASSTTESSQNCCGPAFEARTQARRATATAGLGRRAGRSVGNGYVPTVLNETRPRRADLESSLEIVKVVTRRPTWWDLSFGEMSSHLFLICVIKYGLTSSRYGFGSLYHTFVHLRLAKPR